MVTIPSADEHKPQLPDPHCIIAYRLRLGPANVPNVLCICGRVNLAEDPTHPLECPSSQDSITFRHDTAKQQLAHLAKTLGADTSIEPPFMLGPDSEQIPDLRLILGPQRVLVDVSIRHPLAPSNVRRAQRPLATAKNGEREKIDKYEEDAQRMGFRFVPFVIETTGGWGPRARHLASELATHAQNHMDIPRERALNLLAQAISTAVQFGNAQLLIGCYQSAIAQHNASSRPLPSSLLPDLSHL